MKVFKAYDAEVWFFLKAIWCAVPKISFQKLCDVVKEVTKKEVPSPDSVRKKCKAEGWEKSVRDYCRMADGTLDKVKSRLLDEILEEYNKLQEDADILRKDGMSSMLPANGIPDFTFNVLENVTYKKRKIITVLQEHRNRTGKIGQLLDDSMDWMYQAKEAVLAPNQTEEQRSDAQKRFSLLEAMVEKIEIFSRTEKNLLGMDVILFGINTDDTRDGDTSERMKNILDDSQFDRARESLDEQYARMQEQVAWINSGSFEQEVAQEKEEQMLREQQLSEQYMDADEDDFPED